MPRSAPCLVTLAALLAIPARAEPPPPAFSLPALRQALKTRIFGRRSSRQPAPKPPAEVFERVAYPAPLGRNVAYVSPVSPGPRRPAVLWLHGGLTWDLDPSFWLAADRTDDQTAAAFRQAGLVLMLPALRGANDNPGRNECFLGEVDDVVAAAQFLAHRPDVDPDRIYLAGHSTGATLALLVAESTTAFRAVFAFGPVAGPLQYGKASCIQPSAPDSEVLPRTPIVFLSEIRAPTFIIEGSDGNIDVFPDLKAARRNAPITFVEVPKASHFSVLAPGTEAIAAAILASPTGPIKLSAAAILDRMDPSRR
jgi:acetyl esterase/lipase